MKKIFILFTFFLTGCSMFGAQDSVQTPVTQETIIQDTGIDLAQANLTGQMLSGNQFITGSIITGELAISTGMNEVIFDKEGLNISLPLSFGTSYSTQAINENDLATIQYQSAWGDMNGCKEIYPKIYTFKIKDTDSEILANQIIIYPSYDQIKNPNSTGDDCIDIIKERYQKYANFLNGGRNFAKTDDEFFRFGGFTGAVLTNSGKKLGIEFDKIELYNTPCYDKNFEYKIYFMDKQNRLIEIRYYSILDYVDKFLAGYTNLNKNYNNEILKRFFCDSYGGPDEDGKEIANLNLQYKQFLLDNIQKFNKIDYEDIQAIKKGVLQFISSN